MVKTKAKYEPEESFYSSICGNKVLIRTDDVAPLGEHSFDLEEEIKKHTESPEDRFVFGCKANNESLPFKDETFDCYLANLSLMLVDNHTNQLKEALRVT